MTHSSNSHFGHVGYRIVLLLTCVLLLLGSTGVAHAGYSTAYDTRCVNARSGLRLRSGPGTNYWIKTTLPAGTRVTVTQTLGRWSKISSGWHTGWMYSQYLGNCGSTSGTSGYTFGSCNIKGNISYSTGEKIYHVPGQQYYSQTKINTAYGERWFCSEAEAIRAGWRKSYR